MPQDHWLVRPENIRLLWRLFIGILVVTVLCDLVVEHHPHFGIDGTFGFAAWFGREPEVTDALRRFVFEDL